MQQTYPCPNCSSPVAFSFRFCGNCGTYLNWSTQQSNYRQLRLQQKKTGTWLLFIGLMAIGILTGILFTYGTIISDSSSQASLYSATSMPQTQPEPLLLSATVLSSPGLYTDPGQTIDTLTPSFRWNKVSGADYYSLIISKFPYSSGDIVYTVAQLAGTSLILPGNVLEYGQRYRWTIEAHNNTSSSSVSNALYFQTPQSPPLSLPDTASPSIPKSRQPASTPISPPASVPPWNPVTLPGWTPI